MIDPKFAGAIFNKSACTVWGITSLCFFANGHWICGLVAAGVAFHLAS